MNSDKLKKSESSRTSPASGERLHFPDDAPMVIPFSAERGDGREQLLSFVPLKAAGELN